MASTPANHDPAARHNPNVVLEFLDIGKVPVTIILSTMVFAGWTVTCFGTTLVRQWLPDWLSGALGVLLLAAALVAGVARLRAQPARDGRAREGAHAPR